MEGGLTARSSKCSSGSSRTRLPNKTYVPTMLSMGEDGDLWDAVWKSMRRRRYAFWEIEIFSRRRSDVVKEGAQFEVVEEGMRDSYLPQIEDKSLPRCTHLCHDRFGSEKEVSAIIASANDLSPANCELGNKWSMSLERKKIGDENAGASFD